ncbi:hypothetical protein MRX96_036753 [Rhipicephalus microplus]
MGKTHSILITFDANEVPHSIKYMGAIHRCTPYRGSPDACTNCRLPGHRHDVCPSPKTNLCPTLWQPTLTPRNLLARLSAFCARALILPALVHAKDATFTSHAKRQSNLKRSDKNRFHTGTTSPS